MNDTTHNNEELVLSLQLFDLPNELDFECLSWTSTCTSNQSIC